jgi:glycosyltransferase involved in cell wall biosynthesis
MKLFDCSFNDTAPQHRDVSNGPKNNDIMSDLKKYASEFSVEYVTSWKCADAIITNTTFPDYIKESNKIKVKRMDGIYWSSYEKNRNEVLNESAIIADLVIFISEYSKKSFHALYPNLILKNELVVLNGVDDNVFKPEDYKTHNFIWSANCSNWARPEKRFLDLMKFADYIKQYNEAIFLIGQCEFAVPENVFKIGYINDYKIIADFINISAAFVNFSFRDAGCKCVAQAVACHKPVLYANSGGVPELVRNFGVGVYDKYNEPSFLDCTPTLDFEDIKEAYHKFKDDGIYCTQIHNYKDEVIGQYFNVIQQLVYNKGEII